jgi:multiple sugar transport system permease protein/sorbitol/mannitol transport system permease protein
MTKTAPSGRAPSRSGHSGASLGREQAPARSRGRAIRFPRGLLFLAPALVVMLAVLAVPMGLALYYSFMGWSLIDPTSRDLFVGFSNYTDLFASGEFWTSVSVTLRYGITTVVFELILGTLLAVLLNVSFPGRSIIRTLFLIPMVITPAVIGIFWKLLYEQSSGVFNYFLGLVGIAPVPWLGLDFAFLAIVLADVWQASPFFMLVVLAGLQSVDEEIVGAARVDGASQLQLLRFIVLPHLVPFMLIASAFRLISTMGDFDKIFLLTLGGPGSVTTTMSLYAYKTGFQAFEIGRTTAIAWIFVVLVLAVSSPLIWYLFKMSEKARH